MELLSPTGTLIAPRVLAMTYASSALLSHDSREDEANMLVDLVRLSPATVLLAEAGSEKGVFLRNCVMPLLEAVPHSEHLQICVFFDAWDEQPLRGLLAAIRHAVAAIDSRWARENELQHSLVTLLRKWQESHEATFLIVFDRFEEYLAAREEPGAIEFEDEFVRVLKSPELRANFLIAVDEEAAPGLEVLRARIPGFGDAVVRLPRAVASAVPRPLNEERKLVRTRTFVGSARRAERSPRSPDELPSFEMLKPLVLVGSVASTYTITNAAARIEPLLEDPDRREPVLGKVPAGENLHVASPAPVEQPRPSMRVPPAAWAILGLLLVCALGLLVSTAWQPQPRPVEEAGITPSPPSADITEPPGEPVMADAGAVSYEIAPASPADDQASLPSIKDEVPRKPATPRMMNSAGPMASVFVNVHSEAERTWATRLVQPLSAHGIRVAGIRVVKGGPAKADLQYFRPEDRVEARRVAGALGEIGLPAPRVTRVTGLEARSIPQQYELWLPAGVDKSAR